MISVITPTFNALDSLKRTIRSIQEMNVELEHVIIDGGSTDGTIDYINELRQNSIRFVTGKDEGMYDAIQNGFSRAVGDIQCWLNAGDLYFPWTGSVVEETFRTNRRIQWLTGVPCTLYSAKQVESCSYTPIYHQSIIRKGFHNGCHLPLIQQESTFWTRDLWNRSSGSAILKGQGRGKGFACDYKLWRRFAEYEKLYTVRSPLAAFAVTPGQISEKHRVKYFEECGVSHVPEKPNWVFHQLFKIVSVACTRNAVFPRTVSPPKA